MPKTSLLAIALALTLTAPVAAQTNAVGARASISVRTEQFPRPPSSGATYHIYERDGRTICTKLEVCNKFGQCSSTYERGAYKAPQDVQTGAPYGTTPPMPIAADKLARVACLKRFGLR